MKLKANRQLMGEYGNVGPGQIFEARGEVARSLMDRGLALPVITYETKVIAPEAPVVVPEAPAVAADLPFRDGDYADPEPQGVPAVGDQVLSTAELPTQPERVAGLRGFRRGRGRPRTKR